MQLVGVTLFESTHLQNLPSTSLLSWLPAPLLCTQWLSQCLLLCQVSLTEEPLHLLLPCLHCFLQYLKCLFSEFLWVFSEMTFCPLMRTSTTNVLTDQPHLFLSYTIPFWYIRYSGISVCLHSSIHYHENTMQRFCLYCSLPRTLLGRQQTFSNYLSNISMNQ